MDNNTTRFVSPAPPRPPFPPLGNLTFNQVQTQFPNFRKPLNSMNFDEFLKDLIAISSSSSSSSSDFNLNGELSGKTVDQIWTEIVSRDVNQYHSMAKLGDTTLEEFLVLAGVIDGGNQGNVVDPQSMDWFGFQQLEADFNVAESVYKNFEVSLSDNQMGMTIPMMSAATSSESQVVGERKRWHSDEIMERTIERRQIRMNRNRESAKRSRARKQAYTNNLEVQVANLRESNAWLQRESDVIMILDSLSTPKVTYQLRRTCSSPI